MGRIKFLQWAAAQGWKHSQTYLNKAFNHFYDKGKLPDPKAILQKAKNYYDNFTGFTPTVAPKFTPKIVPKKPNPLADALNAGKYTKVPTPPGLKKSNVIPFPKKPPNLKAEGGRIGTGLNYLLGEDDQNSRVPLKKGKTPFKPPSPGENIIESTWKNMGPWEKLMWGLSLGGFEKGGRVGLADGMTPSESWMRDYFYSGKGGYDHSGMTFKFFQKNIGPDLWNNHIGKAQGGRIGFKEGEGIMSRVGNMVEAGNVPYYAGKGLQGLVNSAETLSKLPLAAGELGSKLIQQKPNKEMFMEAVENITPGSWSENTGLTSLIEGMAEKRSPEAKTVGGILGLGTEIAVPTGGAFKAGQILLSKASKAMGKVKDGKTLNKLVDQKLTDTGQSKRDFMSLVGAGGLAAGLKWLGLGGILKGATKKLDDIEIQVRADADYEYIDEAWSGGTWANVYFNSLTKKGQKILEKLTKGKDSALTYQDGLFVPGNSEEAAMVVQKIIAGHKPNWRLNTATKQVYDKKTKSFVHPKGSEKGAYEQSKNYSGNDLNKATIMKEADDMIASELSPYHSKIEVHDEYFDDILDQITIKKASGGRVPLFAGGTPSAEQLRQYYEEIEKQKKRDRIKKDFYEQRYGGPGPVLEAAQGGIAGMLGE